MNSGALMSSRSTIEFPHAFHDVSIPMLIEIISWIWEDKGGSALFFGRREQEGELDSTRFHGASTPNISVEQYLLRIYKYACQEPGMFLLIVLYAQTIHAQRPRFPINMKSIHRFIIAAITVMTKCFCDRYYTNSFYAKVGGITLQELNYLELDILHLLDWQLVISTERIQECYEEMVALYLARCHVPR